MRDTLFVALLAGEVLITLLPLFSRAYACSVLLFRGLAAVSPENAPCLYTTLAGRKPVGGGAAEPNTAALERQNPIYTQHVPCVSRGQSAKFITISLFSSSRAARFEKAACQ